MDSHPRSTGSDSLGVGPPICYNRASGDCNVVRVWGSLCHRFKCFSAPGLSKVPTSPGHSLSPSSQRKGGEPHSTPPTLTTQYWEGADWQGLLRQQERKPDSGQLPPAQQAVLPADTALFSFSRCLERGAGGAFPPRERAPGCLNPQSRGGSGSEASGSGSTVLPREIQKIGSEELGTHLHTPSPGPGVLPLLRGWGSRLRSEGQHPVPGHKPFLEGVSTFVPHTSRNEARAGDAVSSAAKTKCHRPSGLNPAVYLGSGGWFRGRGTGQGPAQCDRASHSALSSPAPSLDLVQAFWSKRKINTLERVSHGDPE